MATCEALAEADTLSIPLERLVYLARAGKAYRIFTRTTSGKRREVSVPVGDLLAVHDRLFDLLDRIEKPDYLHSGIRGRSHLTNARAHVGHKPVVKLDIRQFFPSIDVPRVSRFFIRQLACSPSVADLLTRLCTFRGHVPIGSRMSQHLAFFAARPMLEDLQRLSIGQGVRFTCYVDDLSFSGTAATRSFLWRVKQIVHHHGFQSHHGHCYRAEEHKLVTGAMVVGHTLAMPPSHIDRLRADARAYSQADLADRPGALNRLIGRLAAAASIDPRHRGALARLVTQRSARVWEPHQLV